MGQKQNSQAGARNSKRNLHPSSEREQTMGDKHTSEVSYDAYVTPDDEELADAAVMCADMLRGLANRWQARAHADRLGRHSLSDSLRLIDRLEAAATFLEGQRSVNSTGHGAASAKVQGHQRIEEEEPWQSEERFRLLVESIRDYAILMLDMEGRITTWNTGAEQLKGYKAEEIIGQHFSRFYPPEDIEAGKPEKELKVASQVGRLEDEGWRVRKDGTRFWASVVITALHDHTGKLVGFGKVTRDFTERKKTEEVLRQSEERFRILVDQIQDYAILMLDPHGNVATWNTGAERLKGYKAEEIIGQPFSRFYPLEEIESGKPQHLLEVAASTGVLHVEGWRVRKDGTRFWAEVTLTALHDSSGTLCGFAKVTRDMTERQKAEEAIRRLNEQLEERVQEQTAELLATNKELESFAYSVSHDLRSPLRAIDGFSRILEEDYADQLDDEGRRLLKVIRDGSQKMGQLIDDLLAFSRLGRKPIAAEGTDMNALVQSVWNELKTEAGEKPVEFIVKPLPSASCDPTLIRQVWVNLVANALKFSSSKPNPIIEVSGEIQGNQSVYSIKDNGVGFDMQYYDKLFGVFQRLHSTEQFPGTGVGLAIVQRIVIRHGGQVRAEGKIDEGATFYFTLPKERRA